MTPTWWCLTCPAHGPETGKDAEKHTKATGHGTNGSTTGATRRPCGEKAHGGRCVMPAGHSGAHGQVGLR